jgi:hypothetical protein
MNDPAAHHATDDAKEQPKNEALNPSAPAPATEASPGGVEAPHAASAEHKPVAHPTAPVVDHAHHHKLPGEAALPPTAAAAPAPGAAPSKPPSSIPDNPF